MAFYLGDSGKRNKHVDAGDIFSGLVLSSARVGFVPGTFGERIGAADFSPVQRAGTHLCVMGLWT